MHIQAQRYRNRGYEIVVVGHPDHEEVEGTVGRIHGPVCLASTGRDVPLLEVRDPDKLAYVSQTILIIDDTRDVIGGLRRDFRQF